ncbi:MAG: hypothetical protein JF592_07020 [Microbacterium sp.]|uniref:hypothetical protein n=1 Tax=Microbacterium sp. TaxID=51671 RepID=UPI001D8E2D41|nr:hypothetical protein [Microbacterium sp.]MBW8762323.1 hypothetical protein [Microbacterium sp.]
MSGIGDQGARPDDVISPGDPDAEKRIANQGGAQHEPVEDVPAGGAGADSGAADTVGVDPASESSVPDESVHNAEPGVGTRRPDDEVDAER